MVCEVRRRRNVRARVKDMVFMSLRDFCIGTKINESVDQASQTDQQTSVVNTSSQTDTYHFVNDVPQRVRNESTCTQTDISYPEFESCDYDDGSARNVEECAAIYKEKVSAMMASLEVAARRCFSLKISTRSRHREEL